MAQWCERSPPTNVARVRLASSASYAGEFFLVLVLAPRVFCPAVPVFLPPPRIAPPTVDNIIVKFPFIE